jgi:hypothetical protein|tara:strand:- start:1468 stop:1683 length:216 start_codon:yes stop_codon:yes gene_type:complete
MKGAIQRGYNLDSRSRLTSDEVYEADLIKLIREFVETNSLDALWGKSEDGSITVHFGTKGFPLMHPTYGAV